MEDLYRLYIDESGDHRYSSSQKPKQRYLGLTGIIIARNIYEQRVVGKIERIRSLFYVDSDNKPPLHLSDIMANKGSFASIKNPEVKTKFDKEFISLISDTDYTVITFVIDKNSHADRGLKPTHTYHYGLQHLLGSYCQFLQAAGGQGDVTVESRGKKEDQLMRAAFRRFYSLGLGSIQPKDIRSLLNSEISIKNKQNLICGLELADMLALPSKWDVLYENKIIEKLDPNFTRNVIEVIQPKYYKNGKRLI